MFIRVAAQTDVGQVREQNEDAHLVKEDLGLCVVADGMGGHLGGHTASSIAVATIGNTTEGNREALVDGSTVMPLESSPVPRLLAESIRDASAAIFEAAQDNADLQGMGTTVTALLVLSGRAFVGHVGDSRCYLQRGHAIIQLTDDHSLVNEQINAGLITKEQARASRLKNIITRSVGFEKDVAVDTLALPVQIGDKFVLCSDGLANFADDTEIGLALATMPLESASKFLVDLANQRGGDDNITVVCVSAEE